MIIVAIVIIFLIPIWAYVGSVQESANTELSLTYAKNTADRITDMSDLIYSQGPPAKIDIRIYMPAGVEAINITNNSIRMRVRTALGVSDISSTSRATLNGTLPATEGYYKVTIEAISDYVRIKKA